MNFDKLVDRLLKENQIPSRISIGPEEVRNIAKTGKVTSKGPYGGQTFFGTKGQDEFRGNMQGLWYSHGEEGPFQPGKKAGYILKGDPSKMQTPSGAGISQDPGYYKDKGFVTLPPESSAESIKTIQRIKQPRSSWTEPNVLGKERDFNRFMQIYNKLAKAFEEGKIKMRPPRITGPGAAGIASLMQFMNTEVPPDMRNSMLAGGGLGIKGKFEATP